MKTFVVPSGIGDVSWIYSKLKHIGEGMRIEVLDGWPYRTLPYLELLPEVKEMAYTPETYQNLIMFMQMHKEKYGTWGALKDAGFGRNMIQCNRHLEAGYPLADWLPDLPTDYHYAINISEPDKAQAKKTLEFIPHPAIGISGASYRGAHAWKTWEENEWLEFFGCIKRMIPEMTFVLLGGSWDDLTRALASFEGTIDLVGKLKLGTSVEVMRGLDGYIGFSSGLGILNTVQNRPTVMLWPEHQAALSSSWADPEQLGDLYIPLMYMNPQKVANFIKKWLKDYIGKEK